MIDKRISVVIPCYNEQDNILYMYDRLKKTLCSITDNHEIIYINNGSYDDSDPIFRQLAAQDVKVSVISLSRNFGSQGAYTCGIEYATGDCVVCIDGDIQDPPEMIEQMVTKWLEGYHVVYGIRKKRKGNLLMRISYKLFYRILKRLSYVEMPLDASDFALIDRVVVDILNSLPERNRFLRGLRSWIGFRQTGIEYTRDARKVGKSKFSFLDNIRWASMGIFSFSYSPLEFISMLAVTCVGLSILGILYYVLSFFISGTAPRGFSTIIVAILFLGGIQLLCLGIIGDYLGKIFEEVKQRPKYITQEILNDHRET